MRERKINRMKGFDYKTPGYYYITICTKDRKEWFGKMDGRKVVLNSFGTIVEKHWVDLPHHYVPIELDEYIIMPNHLHGIIKINVGNGLKPFPTHIYSLSEVIRGFKTFSSKEIRILNQNFRWQKSFYDNIIRTEYSLQKIREYIRWNPLKWDIDPENKEVTVSR
ncbi:MAG: transposase [bacterium]|nr:transposase [bacterium]